MKNIIPLITCFVLLFTSCGKPPQTQTSPNPEAPITGPEVWNVNGPKFNIEGTALLVMGNGQTLFIFKALCDFAPDQTHRPLARAITKYAVDNGYPSKVKESSWNGKPTPPSDGIGVALLKVFDEFVGRNLIHRSHAMDPLRNFLLRGLDVFLLRDFLDEE